MKRKLGKALYFLLFSLLFVCSIIFRGDLSSGVSYGINYSLKVLIPSLFPLIFLSALISASPLAGTLSRLASPVTRFVFKLPGQCFMPIFFGITCGYPVGARLTASLLTKGEITKEEAARLLLFVVNPGIPFAVLFVGGAILGNLAQGFMLFLSTSLSSLALGIFMGIGKPVPPKKPGTEDGVLFMTAMDIAARSTLSATCTMCLYVIIFSAYLPLLHRLGIFQQMVKLLSNPLIPPQELAALLSFIGDVVHGVSDAAALHVGAHIYAIGLSFGGICVHLQVFSCFKQRPVSLAKFYSARAVHAVLTLAVFALLLSLFPRSAVVMSSLSQFTASPLKGTATGSLCLLLLACTYIFLSGDSRLEKRKF